MSLGSFFTRNWLRKLAALVFAILIYYLVNDSLKKIEDVHDVPVTLNLSQDLIMTTPQKFTVSVRVRSIPGEKALDARSVSAVVDITTADHRKNGIYTVRLRKENFRAPSGIKIVDFMPKELTVKLQRLIRLDVPVEPRFSGKLPENYRLSETVCTPKSVTVSGAENEVAGLKNIPTNPIPLADCERGFEYETELAPPQNVSVDPGRVKVQIGIENIIKREYQKVPVGIFGDGEAGMNASLVGGESAVTVTLRGTERALDQFTAQDIRLYVDVYNVSSPGVYACQVNCHIRRSGIEVDSIVPAELKVSIIKAPIKKP